jgi:hypothetical protein
MLTSWAGWASVQPSILFSPSQGFPMPNPHSHHSINVSTGKSSHILLKHSNNLPAVANPAAPNVGEIIGAKCKDIDNGPFYFSPNTVIAQGTNKKRLAIRIISQAPGGSADITEGTISVTLLIFTGEFTPPDEMDVETFHVDYISDPTSPC